MSSLDGESRGLSRCYFCEDAVTGKKGVKELLLVSDGFGFEAVAFVFGTVRDDSKMVSALSTSSLERVIGWFWRGTRRD